MGAKSPAAEGFSASAAVRAMVPLSESGHLRRCSTARLGGGLSGLGTSDGGAGGSGSGSLVGRAVLLDADVEVFGEFVGVDIGEGGVGAFDAAQGGGGDFGCGGQFGLGEAFDDAPVSGVALVGGDGDDVLNRGVEDAHHPGQQVDLGGVFARFPVKEGGRGDVGQSGQVADTDAPTVAGFGEGVGVESAQDAARHRRSVPRSIVEQIHRSPLKPVNAIALYYRRRLESGVGEDGMLGRNS